MSGEDWRDHPQDVNTKSAKQMLVDKQTNSLPHKETRKNHRLMLLEDE